MRKGSKWADVRRRTIRAKIANPEGPCDKTLALILKSSKGRGEITADIDHPAVAAFRRSMEEGQLTGTWRYLLVNDLPSVAHTIVGTFVRTPNQRVLFFPGAAIAIETDDPTARFNRKRLDHITADPPRGTESSSHVAVQDLPTDESRGINYRAAPPSEHMFPWFSLLVPDLLGFTELAARLVVRFPPPPGNVRDFGQRLLSDGDVASVPLPAAAGPGPTYVQFDVWLGRGPDWRTLRVRPLAWAYKLEIVEGAPEDQQKVIVNRVDIDLDSDVGLAILVSRPAGRLLGAPRILRPKLSR